MIHGTEQPIPRPKDKRKRKTHYSEKKHTIKNQIRVNLDGIIMHKSTYSPESHHHYSTYKSKHLTLSEELLQFYELRYLGVQKDFPNQHSTVQEKERKNINHTSKGIEQVTVKN